MSVFRLFAVAAMSLALAAPALAQSATRTRLLSSSNPSTAGQTVRLLAEVDGLGGGAPQGTVKFVDGYSLLGAGALSPFGAGQEVIAAGGWHNCALTDAGGVACWGNNGAGQLGDGTRTDQYTPIAVPGLSSGVVAIAAGTGHSCALTIVGAVKCWGFPFGGDIPTSVPGLSSGVVAISAGGEHSCALTRAGAVKCWGRNYYGQLGNGNLTIHWQRNPVAVSGLSSGVVAISAGREHSCALTGSGAVKRWGDNRYGELGDGTTTVRRAPIAVSGLSSGVVAVGAGFWHSCALTSAGAVKCWGYNGLGQLGDGTYSNRFVPGPVSGLSSGIVAMAAGGVFSCALTNGGGAKCWGWNDSGQLGNGTTTARRAPTAVSGLTTLVRARASLSTSALGVGVHTLRAGFRGDASHTGIIGGLKQTVE